MFSAQHVEDEAALRARIEGHMLMLLRSGRFCGARALIAQTKKDFANVSQYLIDDATQALADHLRITSLKNCPSQADGQDVSLIRRPKP